MGVFAYTHTPMADTLALEFKKLANSFTTNLSFFIAYECGQLERESSDQRLGN